MLTFEDFKKTCFHTKERLVIPLLKTYIDKKELMKKGKYNFDKENQLLMNIYEEKFKK